MEWRKADVFWTEDPASDGETSYSAGVRVRIEPGWVHVREDDEARTVSYPSSQVRRVRWWEEPVHPALAD